MKFEFKLGNFAKLQVYSFCNKVLGFHFNI